MYRNLLIPSCLLSILIVLGCGAQAFQEKSSKRPPTPTRVPITENTSVNLQAMAGLSWWHQEALVAELKLDSDQQQKMDGHLEELLRGWQPNLKMRKGVQRRFAQALRAADFKKARKIAEDFGQAEAFFSSGSLSLKADVLSELRPEQLQQLLEKHPRILKRRWISSSKIKTTPQGK